MQAKLEVHSLPLTSLLRIRAAHWKTFDQEIELIIDLHAILGRGRSAEGTG